MGLGSIGLPGFLLILLVALLLFGPSKLPELGRAAGRTLKEFKDSVAGINDDDKQNKPEATKQDVSAVQGEAPTAADAKK
ncbi:twin-arginine translocase TatA/TatE family subunit [Desmospora activa]|uniref:Sec-independent protein translocase protein TatA n=1 Tax=Desmospora activa DSM 45169 TaxID=1121389 RepID=A0A2T4Z8F5_9BACL|nr:twin-arginine translocase TatA/TatE family subunit [Desmospora activa]PTM58181.1 sec-independent protein translocase protein TatA [Desmospora activa DSM 45169]